MTTLRLPRLRAKILVASISLAFTSLAAAAAPAAYTVNFTTPWQIGQAYTTSVSASETTRIVITMGEQKLQEQTQQRSAKMDADSKALEVYPHGGLRKAEFTLRTLLASVNGAPEAAFLPPGTKIVAENTGETEKSYTINGAAATTEQQAVLKLVISLDDEKNNDQAIFGPKKPVAVGETWKLDEAPLKETLGKGIGTIGAAEGTMRLNAVEGAGPAQISIVSGNVAFTGIKPELPPGITPRTGTFKAVLDGRIPASRSASTRVENLNATADLSGEAAGPNGAVLTFRVKAEAKNATVLTFP